MLAVVIAAFALRAPVRFDACLGKCGAKTHCASAVCVADEAPIKTMPADAMHKRRRHVEDHVAAEELTLKPGDDRMTAEGDALGRTEHIDLSEPNAHELTQDQMDRVFTMIQPAISHCMTEAVGDYPLEHGRVEVGLRIERSGDVRRVRVEAPSILLKRGLTRCVRPLVTGLHFPSSGGSMVATYPFELH